MRFQVYVGHIPMGIGINEYEYELKWLGLEWMRIGRLTSVGWSVISCF